MTITYEDWQEVVKTVKEERVEITLTTTPESTEMVVRPWEPYRPTCPYAKEVSE